MDKDLKDFLDFEKDLVQFIKAHQYIKDENAGVTVSTDQYDDTEVELHTVDGAYERILIKIIPIS